MRVPVQKKLNGHLTGGGVCGGSDQMISGSAGVVLIVVLIVVGVGAVVVRFAVSHVSSSSPVSIRRRSARSVGPVHTMP